MNNQIIVAFVRNGDDLSCAAVLRERCGVNTPMDSSSCIVEPTIPLQEAVVRLLVAVEVQSDIMIKEVVCQHNDCSPEESQGLAEAIRVHDVIAIPVFHNAKDAASLATWWADRISD